MSSRLSLGGEGHRPALQLESARAHQPCAYYPHPALKRATATHTHNVLDKTMSFWDYGGLAEKLAQNNLLPPFSFTEDTKEARHGLKSPSRALCDVDTLSGGRAGRRRPDPVYQPRYVPVDDIVRLVIRRRPAKAGRGRVSRSRGARRQEAGGARVIGPRCS